jgi:hypothetical protein
MPQLRIATYSDTEDTSGSLAMPLASCYVQILFHLLSYFVKIRTKVELNNL